MKRIICLLLCVVMTVCCLTGCLYQFDAKAYLQGNLDVIYLNKITDEYLKIVSNSREELEEVYEQGLEVEAEYFADYFRIELEYAPEGTFERIVEVYRQIYAYSKYEISEPEKSGDSYLINVTVYPIDIIQKVLKEDWAEFEAEWTGMADQISTMTDEEIEALWSDMIITMVEERIPNIGYLEPQTLTIEIAKGSDGVYTISDNDFGRIDALVIQY